MKQDKATSGVTEGADDILRLQRMRFPELTVEQVKDLAEFAREFRLNIWANHVWGKLEPIGRDKFRMTPVVMIHGLLARAWATGLCGDIEEPKWEFGDDGRPIRATVVVHRRDGGLPPSRATGVAWMEEYYGGKGTMWDTKPKHMLAKCALAIALRNAFPDELGGLYCPEELDQPAPTRRMEGAASSLKPVPDEDGRVLDVSTAQV